MSQDRCQHLLHEMLPGEMFHNFAFRFSMAKLIFLLPAKHIYLWTKTFFNFLIKFPPIFSVHLQFESTQKPCSIRFEFEWMNEWNRQMNMWTLAVLYGKPNMSKVTRVLHHPLRNKDYSARNKNHTSKNKISRMRKKSLEWEKKIIGWEKTIYWMRKKLLVEKKNLLDENEIYWLRKKNLPDEKESTGWEKQSTGWDKIHWLRKKIYRLRL